jgi:hypothetical protein
VNLRDISVGVDLWNIKMEMHVEVVTVKGRKFDSHRGQAYFSSLPGVDVSE